jgi:6 kDa early secretory antigenic target
MSDMHYNFTGIEGGAGAIQAAVSTTDGLLNEGQQSLAKLAEAWGGSGSDAYQAVQKKWDTASQELKDALQSLGRRTGEAGQAMSQTESGVTGMFT